MHLWRDFLWRSSGVLVSVTLAHFLAAVSWQPIATCISGMSSAPNKKWKAQSRGQRFMQVLQIKDRGLHWRKMHPVKSNFRIPDIRFLLHLWFYLRLWFFFSFRKLAITWKKKFPVVCQQILFVTDWPKALDPETGTRGSSLLPAPQVVCPLLQGLWLLWLKAEGNTAMSVMCTQYAVGRWVCHEVS